LSGEYQEILLHYTHPRTGADFAIQENVFMGFHGEGCAGGFVTGIETKPSASRAFSGNTIGSVDHLVPTGHDQWKLRGPQIKPHVEAEDRQAMTG
jgi:hypothetical protein